MFPAIWLKTVRPYAFSGEPRKVPGRPRLFSPPNLSLILCVHADCENIGIAMHKKKPDEPRKKPVSPKPSRDFSAVFNALQEILSPYEKRLKVLPYKPGYYCLVTRLAVLKGKPVWFAAIRMGKNYVSYHFMPVYVTPAMQKQIPPELKKRMQGKACFNFAAVDPQLFRQLAKLTAAGFADYRRLRYV